MGTLHERLDREAAFIAKRALALDRASSPTDTVARLRPRCSDFGITRLAELTDLDMIGIPVWASVRPNARTLAVCQGKGASDGAAQASALMEAIEIAIAERDDHATRRASRADLEAIGDRADPLPGLIKRGFAAPPADEAIDWIEGYDFLQQNSVWVPHAAVRLDSTDVTQRYWQSSDGLASGNLLIEAVLHGLCERIERDAMVLWMLRPDEHVRRCCFDPRLFADEVLTGLVHSVEAAGLRLRVFDMTSDIGVPAFFATVSAVPDGHEADWTHFDVASGYGCHMKPARAAMRAVTEAVQSRLTVISGARDDFQPERYRARLKPDIATYIRAVPRRDYPVPADFVGGVEDYLPYLLRRLSAANVTSVVAVPLQSDRDFAVCKMIVPDLEYPPGDRRQRFGRRALSAMVHHS